jgi:hypothetical protein
MSNVMRLSLIQDHFGGSHPIALSEYYLYNGYVNASSYVPEQGSKISFSQFVNDFLLVPQQHTACLTSNNGFNINLNTVANWHTESNLQPLIDASFSNFYQYLFDGYEYANSVSYMNDGGNDMFDTGNLIDIWGNCITGFSNVSYGTINTERTHGFYVSPSNIWPNTTIVYVQNGTSLINVHGNKGSDGSGTVTNDKVSYTTSNNRYGDIFYNANGLASDPSILDIWFTIQNSNWGSVITASNDQREIEDRNDYNHSVGITGSNYLLVKTLLSLSNGDVPSTQQVNNFVSAYVYNIPLTITSSNINVDNRLPYGEVILED